MAILLKHCLLLQLQIDYTCAEIDNRVGVKSLTVF